MGRPVAPMGFARAPMGFSRAPMGFARGPQMRPQFFAPRSSAFARPRPAIIRPRPSFAPRQRGFFSHGGPFFFTPGFSGRFGHHRFHHYPYLYAFPYYYGGYGGYWDPYYSDYWNPYSLGSYSYDPTANSSSYTDLSNQMSQLSSEVDQLRDENDSLRSSLYEQQRPPAAPAPAATIGTPSGNDPPTVPVHRACHRPEVQNYAIVGSTLWSLSPSRANKIPLADLNIDQTIKINQDRGISFQVPKQ